MKKKTWKTAAELVAELNSDPEYLAGRDAADEKLRKLAVKQIQESLPVLSALHEAGVHVNSIWDLSLEEHAHPGAVPVLLDQLDRPQPDHVIEGILRALATPSARNYWGELIVLLQDTSRLPPQFRYLAAYALSCAADDEVLEDLIRLVKDKSLGMDRAPLLLSLLKSKLPKAKMALLELRDDPDLGKEVKRLRRLSRLGRL